MPACRCEKYWIILSRLWIGKGSMSWRQESSMEPWPGHGALRLLEQSIDYVELGIFYKEISLQVGSRA